MNRTKKLILLVSVSILGTTLVFAQNDSLLVSTSSTFSTPGSSSTLGQILMSSNPSNRTLQILPQRTVDGHALNGYVFDVAYTNSAAANGFLFRTGSSNRLIINESGNVGIGTISPSNKLHIIDNVNSEVLRIESSTNSSQIFLQSTGTGGLGWKLISTADGASIGGGKFSIFGNAQHRFVLDQNGNVGIGTSSPGGRLASIAPNGSTMSLILGRSDNSNYWNVNHAGNDFRLYNTASSGSNILFGVDSGGIIQSNNVGIGTATPSHKLEVNGTVRSKEVIVEATGWPDYVFNPEYNLLSLEEIEAHIKDKGHLPEVPSAKEVEEGGQHLGEMQQLLLKKIEELTLYAINQEKVITTQQELIKEITSRLEQLESKN